MVSTIKKIGNDTEIDQLLNKTFLSKGREGYVEVGDDKICLPIYYKKYEEIIRNFEVRDDDIFIVAHPKTGTTWLQELLWLVVNDLDYEGAKKEFLYIRSIHLEFCALFDLETRFEGHEIPDLLKIVNNQKSPRVIKTHLPWSLLPEQIRNGIKKPKIFSTLRNAEDTCVSLYHHSLLVDGYKGNFEDFCKLFLAGRVCFGPFWKQILSCWEQRDNPNVLFLAYKEMKENMRSVLEKVTQFLGKNLTEKQVSGLIEHLSFNSMKNNPTINKKKYYKTFKEIGLTDVDGEFVRSGKIGGYKTEMSPELIEEFKIWTEKNLKGTGLSLK